MRFLPISLALVAVGCGSDPVSVDLGPPPDPIAVCGPMLPKSAMPSLQVAGLGTQTTPELSVTLLNSGVCTEVTTALTRAEAPDLLPSAGLDGYTAIGGAVAFSGPAEIAAGPFPHGIDFVVPADLALAPANAPADRIVVITKTVDGRTLIVPASNIVFERFYKRLHFHGVALGTYQAAIPKTAGKTVHRHFTWRGIGGVSMGGFGSTVNFWTHPDRYDVIAVMGADPGADFTYTLGWWRLVLRWFLRCSKREAGPAVRAAPQADPRAARGVHGLRAPQLPARRRRGADAAATDVHARLPRPVTRARKRGLCAQLDGSQSGRRRLPAARHLPSVLSLSPSEFCDPDRIKKTALRDFHDRLYNPDCQSSSFKNSSTYGNTRPNMQTRLCY